MTKFAVEFFKRSVLKKIKAYTVLAKIRLTTSVLVSSMAGYVLGAGTIEGMPFSWFTFLLLVLGGFLVIASSNGFNQVYEKDTDGLMKRTAERPLPTGVLSPTEGMIFSTIAGVIGLLILSYINMKCAVFGAIALVLYAAVYTPLKRVSPVAVLVGAFPGAIPAMLGWVAATDQFGMEPGILFGIQFLWQFPHFWAIAWLQDDEYKKAGIRLLPTGLRDKRSAIQAMAYTLWLIPLSLLPAIFPYMGIELDLKLSIVGGILVLACGIFLFRKANTLVKECSMEAARKLMFSSLIYLPLVQLIYVIDKFL